MINFLINLLKTIGILFIIIILMIPISFLTQTSKNKNILENFGEEKIRETCIVSPNTEHFQACFRKELVKLLSNFTPHDTLKIVNLIEETYRLDQYHNSDGSFNIETELLYFENWIVLIENQGNLGINRNDMSFFDIVIIPYVKYSIKKHAQEMLSYSKESFALKSTEVIDQKTFLRIKRITEKLNLLKLD